MSKRPLIVVGPVPPPRHGVTISTSLVLANPLLRDRFEVLHLDTSDRRTVENIGRWDPTNVRLGLASVWGLFRLSRNGRGVVYLPISQNGAGFLRDSLLIHVARLRGWSVVAHLRGSELHHLYARAAPPFRLWMRFTLARLDSLAVLGESVRDTLSGLIPADRIAVVPNGTPDPGFTPEARKDSTVLYLSNLRRRKGVLESVDAALAVIGRHPSARFVFAGDWEDDALRRKLIARAAPAGERILFVGPVGGERKRELLRSSALLLFPPALPEGQPRVVLEALAAGLPLVTTDRGTIAETVGPDGAAFVLKDPVPEELAERVLLLLDDDALRTRMGAAARNHYLSLYTQEQADRRMADWLMSLGRGSVQLSGRVTETGRVA